MSLQVLDNPLPLKEGSVLLAKINGHFLMIAVVSDRDGFVSYTFPLRPGDKTVHTVPKCAVYIPLNELRHESSLNLSFSDGMTAKKLNRRANFLHANSVHFRD